MADFIRIHEKDNVAVALRNVPKGTAFRGITAAEDIQQGHKMALQPINPGENIIKYGFPIGHATEDITLGSHVHTHNMSTNLSGEVKYTYTPDGRFPEPIKPLTFMGYDREDGKVGIRNEIWILPTVGCVNDIAKALVRENQDLVTGSVEGLHCFTHPFGCSQTGEDHGNTKRLLAALAKHPNAGAVLVLSLGCENLTQEQFREELGEYDENRIKFLICQNVEDEMEEGRELLKQCAEFAGQFARKEMPASELIVGLKCGGSDGLSGITANPTVGKFSDTLCAMGGTTILTEVPEMFGAEGFLMNRCVDKKIFDRASSMLNGFKDYFIAHNEVVYDNPSPGNKAGGITTLEDKSCGCVQKGGAFPIVDVLGYAQPVRQKGLNMLWSPGNDLVSSTALAASGCHIILFTTGRGTPFGCPVPTAKLATNTPLAQKKQNWIDFSAGDIADGRKTIDEMGTELMDFVLAVASGKQVKAEENACREISIFKDGVML